MPRLRGLYGSDLSNICGRGHVSAVFDEVFGVLAVDGVLRIQQGLCVRSAFSVPAVETLFWTVSSDEKEGIPKKIRCYFIENGERAVLIPENEFQKPEQKFWRF